MTPISIPLGGELTFGTTTCGQNYKFAGMERDSETGHDHTMFRQYASNFGRWMSPDPLAGDISNPQSLNRYAYVMNNPTTLVDSLGLQCSPGPQCPPNGIPPSCTTFSCAEQLYPVSVGNFLQSTGPGWDEFQLMVGIASGSSGEIYEPTLSTSVVSNWFGGWTLENDLAVWINWGFDFEVAGGPGQNIITQVIGPVFLNTNTMQSLGLVAQIVQPASPPQGLKTLPYVALPPPGVFFPKNYCGPGANGGWPTNNVDAACMQHDEAYADAGINWRTKLNLMVNPWASRGKKQAAAADQELCSSVGSVVPASSQEFYDQWGVSLFFGCSD